MLHTHPPYGEEPHVTLDQKPRERSFIRDLVPTDWHPTREQRLRTITIAIVIVVVLSVLTLIGLPFGITLWGWAQLLIVPAVLAMGGYLFTWSANRHAQILAENQMRDAALQAYLDQMGELLIHENLREASLKLYERQDVTIEQMPHVDVNTLAIARTLTVLPRLDADRKRSVLQFLYEAGLIYSA